MLWQGTEEYVINSAPFSKRLSTGFALTGQGHAICDHVQKPLQYLVAEGKEAIERLTCVTCLSSLNLGSRSLPAAIVANEGRVNNISFLHYALERLPIIS
jgi:hypothetical protein